jgi:hypothetical protein
MRPEPSLEVNRLSTAMILGDNRKFYKVAKRKDIYTLYRRQGKVAKGWENKKNK